MTMDHDQDDQDCENYDPNSISGQHNARCTTTLVLVLVLCF